MRGGPLTNLSLRRLPLLAFSLLWAWSVAWSLVAQAQGLEPELREQTVLRVHAWNGSGYSQTLVPQEMDTVYLLSGAPSIIDVLHTQVFTWPLTGDIQDNTRYSGAQVLGDVLRIEGGPGSPLEVPRQPFTFSSSQAEQRSTLLIGEAAVAAYADYRAELDAYFQAMQEFYRQQVAYQRALQELEASSSPGPVPQPPQAPEPPDRLVSEPRSGFPVALPPGAYRLTVLQGNGPPVIQKTLRVLAPEAQGLILHVRAASAWTRVEISQTPQEVLYTKPGETLYLEPAGALLVNAHGFSRAVAAHRPSLALAAQGTRQWIPTGARPEASLMVRAPGEPSRSIPSQDFYVQQIPDAALGYRIRVHQEDDPWFAFRRPDFRAHPLFIQLEPGQELELHFADANGHLLPGSRRIVRTVARPPQPLLLALALVPAAAGTAHWLWRRRATRG